MQSIDQRIDQAVARIPMGLAIRGIVAIVFGVAILVWPNVSLSGLVYLIAAFAAVDGVVSLALAFAPLPGSMRLWFILNGIAGIGVGVITIAAPGITELALLYVVGAWAIILGVIQVVLAFTAPVETRFRVVSLLYGVVAVAFGAIMFVRPGTGALGLLALISAFAIVTGITLIGAAWGFQSIRKDVREKVAGAMTSRA
jgi:uncharacterized membrane protein HdeD (DUF308 family)